MKHALFAERLILMLVALLWLSYSCKNDSAADSTPKFTGQQDFDKFYLRFHRDTAYQAAHITFPLEGLPPNADSATIADESYRWQRENWVPHTLFDDPQFERSFSTMNDFMVVELIRDTKSSVVMMRRWAKMGDEWYLIYYAAPNHLALQE
jgi:hypothetical protein